MPHTKAIIKCRPFYLRPYSHSQKEDCPDNIRRTCLVTSYFVAFGKKKIIACVQANFCHFLEGNEQQPFIGDYTENSVSRAVQMLQIQILNPRLSLNIGFNIRLKQAELEK